MGRVLFENVCKEYETFTAVRDFNLTIDEREFLVLVGPSGCGKSTLLRMVAGLEEISRGKLFIDSECVNNLAPKDRGVAMVFQDYALYPHLSVRENMGFALKMRGVGKSEIAQRVAEAAKILDLEHLLERKPKQLSGGQRQRVAIGRAIVRDPKVFLFDEPLSNLDAKLRNQMRVELAKLHKRLETTIIYVTHDQIEAMTLADRIVVMKDGVIQQVGSPRELYQKPANSFVGSFIGSPSMNQFPAEIMEDNGAVTLCGDGFRIVSREFTKESRQVMIGIRPEHLLPTARDAALFQAQIDVVEPIGSETYLYFTLGSNHWIAKCEGLADIREGETVGFSVELDELHIFTNDGSRRLNS